MMPNRWWEGLFSPGMVNAQISRRGAFDGQRRAFGIGLVDSVTLSPLRDTLRFTPPALWQSLRSRDSRVSPAKGEHSHIGNLTANSKKHSIENRSV